MTENANPVCKQVEQWIDSREPTPEIRKAFMEHFEGWSDEKQNEMAAEIEYRKLKELCAGLEELFEPWWIKVWKKVLKWIGL